MTRRVEEIRDEAMQLSPEERSWLANELHDSIQTAEEREIEEAWIAEAERRWAEVEAGTAKLIPADEVIAELKSRYARGSSR